MELSGKLVKVFGTKSVSGSFTKRVFVIDECSIDTQKEIAFELANEKTELVDQFKVGDFVKVSFNISSKEWLDKSNSVRYFTTLHAWKIEALAVRSGEVAEKQELF